MVKFFNIKMKKRPDNIIAQAQEKRERNLRQERKDIEHKAKLAKLDQRIAVAKKHEELSKVKAKMSTKGGGGFRSGLMDTLGDIGNFATGSAEVALGTRLGPPPRKKKRRPVRRTTRKRSGKKKKKKSLTINF